jgi:hypothetical protein
MQNRKPVICDSCRRSGTAGAGQFKSLQPLLDFAPVPRRCNRHDGWTAERQRAFIAALAESGSVSLAAKAVNMAPEGAYMLRRQPGSESFRDAWDQALDHGAEIIDANAIDRATNGVAVPIFHAGEQVGERRVYNERLTMWMLQHRKPRKYGAAKRGHLDADAIDHAEAIRADALANHKDWLDKLARLYARRVAQEHECRQAGDVTAADFYLRQLTHMEVLLELNGGGKLLLAVVENGGLGDGTNGSAFTEPGKQIWQTEISQALDAHRREIWASAGAPTRPPLSPHLERPLNGIVGGADQKDREDQLRAAQGKAAEAQRLWEQAAREEWEALSGRPWEECPSAALPPSSPRT